MTEEQELMLLAEDPWIYPYVSFLNLAGMACLIFFAARYFFKSRENRQGKVDAWSIDWLNFGMLVWLMFACVFLTGLLMDTFGAIAQEEETHNGKVWQIVLSGISMQGGMLLVFLYYFRYRPELFLQKINAVRLPALKAISIGALLFLAAFPVVFFVGLGWQWFLHQLTEAGLELTLEPQELVQQFTQNIPLVARLLLILMATVTAPVVEELIFRGAIYRFLKSRMNPALAGLTSAIVFAAIHFNLASFPSLIVLGIFLCIAYEMTGNLKTPIFLHAIFNINSLVLINNADVPIDELGYCFGETTLLLWSYL